MENKYLWVHIDGQGHITKIRDKQVDRDLIHDGAKANRLVMYDDRPLFWDAWDIELYYREKGWGVSEAPGRVSLEIGMRGPLLVSLERRVRLSGLSTLHQVISLTCVSKVIEFNTRIHWYEEHKLLKVEFPVAIAADQATFECPFGQVTRPTHTNTSWDVARFEVCGHRFADLSEPDYGLAILNDCKYGYSVHGSTIELSLLRAPKMPDQDCDKGEHIMRFAMFPHVGDVKVGQVAAAAAKFNAPLLWTSASPGKYDARWLGESIINFDNQALVIETIKFPEGDNQEPSDVVFRAYEPFGCRGRAKLQVHSLLVIKSLIDCDLLERPSADLSRQVLWDNEQGHWIVPYLPFQIRTFSCRLELRDQSSPDRHSVANEFVSIK